VPRLRPEQTASYVNRYRTTKRNYDIDSNQILNSDKTDKVLFAGGPNIRVQRIQDGRWTATGLCSCRYGNGRSTGAFGWCSYLANTSGAAQAPVLLPFRPLPVAVHLPSWNRWTRIGTTREDYFVCFTLCKIWLESLP